jgi:RNA polymerase sigma-70 factor (ECF subfamily)
VNRHSIRNIAISSIRKPGIKSGSLDHLQDAAGFEPTDGNSQSAPEHALQRFEEINLVQKALQEIPEEFRQPLVLKEIDGMTYEEIANVLDIPLGTVRSRIFRARQELISKLQRLSKDLE